MKVSLSANINKRSLWSNIELLGLLFLGITKDNQTTCMQIFLALEAYIQQRFASQNKKMRKSEGKGFVFGPFFYPPSCE